MIAREEYQRGFLAKVNGTAVYTQNEVRVYIALDVDYKPVKGKGYHIMILHMDFKWYPVALYRDELKAQAVCEDVAYHIKKGKSEYHCGPDEFPYKPNWIPYPEY